jgi:Uma2 family endonuclease
MAIAHINAADNAGDIVGDNLADVQARFRPHAQREENGHIPQGDSPLPPLENGDHLTRYEFERRYAAMPPIKKAELVEGVVYMPSPVRSTHAITHMNLNLWLGTYGTSTPSVYAYDNATVRLDADNEVQPDALLRLEEALGGTSRISDDDYVEGAPELIVEIAASSATYDLYDKYHVYRRCGVREYVVWQLHERRLNWFQLQEGSYTPLAPDEAGVVRSVGFPGLHLNVKALLSDDMPQVLTTLRQGMKTKAYAAFVDQIRSAKP